MNFDAVKKCKISNDKHEIWSATQLFEREKTADDGNWNETPGQFEMSEIWNSLSETESSK